MTRILHIINQLAPCGAEILLLNVLKYSNRKEFDYHIMLPYGEGELDYRAREMGVELHHLGGAKCGHRKLLSQGVEKIKSLKPDLINTHNRCSDMIGLYGGKIAGVKKRMITVHQCGMYFLESKPFYMGVMEYFIVRYASHFVAVSNSVKEYVMKYGNIRDDRITVIYNGIDMEVWKKKPQSDRSAIRNSLGLSDDDFVVVAAARLFPEKGFDHLIREFRIFSSNRKNAKLVICGCGPSENNLKNLVKKLDLENRILFLGNIPYLREMFNAADCFALSSRKEGFGLAFVEAMASGLPVIGSNVGSIPELIRHEKDGLIFNIKISSDLAKMLDRIYSDKTFAAGLAVEGRKKALEQFDVTVTSRRNEELYGNLLGIN
jgi:glycosyltransferase involved in cell wall biosynthesis